jgi:2-dehydrotetronate isomerase
MPRLAANLSFMFTEVPFLDRVEAAAKAGFKGVEALLPYEAPAKEIAARLKTNGIAQVLLNTPSGDWANGERGITALPGREAEFRDGVRKALDYAGTLECPRIHAVAGIMPTGTDRGAYEATYRANLAFAAEQAAKQGVTVTIELINTRDIPGFFLSQIPHARQVIADVGRPNLKFQFDTYHVQIMHGDVTKHFEANLDQIGHIQVSGVPDRNEPDHGELNHDWLFQVFDKAGYAGWVSGEYRPRASTVAGLGWAKRWGVG